MTDVQRTKELVWSALGNKALAKGEWLVVDVTVRNISNQNFGLNTHDFELVDGTGVKYQHSSELPALGNYQQQRGLSAVGGQVPPGVPVKTALKTALVFDVNPEAVGFKLDLKQAKTMVDLGG